VGSFSKLVILVYSRIKSNLYLTLIILAALYFRIYSVAVNGIGYTIDSKNYIKQAKLLLDGKYSLYFPNGFPSIIAVFLPFDNFIDLGISIIILNIILSTLTVYLIYEICRESFGKKYIAFIAVTIAAIYPNQIKYVHWFLSEVPAAFFITLSLYLFTKKKYIISGAALGFASMIRTTLLPVGIFFSLYLLIKKNIPVYKYFIFFSLVILAFLIYGYTRTGVFTIGQNAAHNLSITTEYSDTASFPRVHLKTLNGSLSDYVQYAINNPYEFVSERLENLWDLWGPMPPWGESWAGRSKFFWEIGLRFPLLLLALFGFINSDKNFTAVFSIIAIADITVVHMLYFADPRFTYTIEPFAVILASIGILNIFERGINLFKHK
jgi:Dolichyl-phosphate-mannose-protein mannosyltransferase